MFKFKMSKHLPSYVNVFKFIYSKERFQIPEKENSKEKMPIYIKVQTCKTPKVRKGLEISQKKKRCNAYSGTTVQIIRNFSLETMETRDSRTIYLKH